MEKRGQHFTSDTSRPPTATLSAPVEHLERASEPAPAAPPEPKDWWGSGTVTLRPTAAAVAHQDSPKPGPQSAFLPAIIFLGGLATMVGSALPWVTAAFLGHQATVAGTDHALTSTIGVNGWETFGGGAALLALGGLMIVSGERALRWLALLLALATAGFAAYDIVRIIEKIDDAHNRAAAQLGPLAAHLAGHVWVGYGLVTVVVAAGVTLLATFLAAGSSQ